MAEVCGDCGRPFADDACSGCHRSKRGGWPVGKSLEVGKGGPGLTRASPAGRVYQMSFRLDALLVDKLKAAAIEQGCAVGKIVRELIEDGLRYRRRNGQREEITDEKRAQLAELSKPGTYEHPPATDQLQPVHEYGRFER